MSTQEALALPLPAASNTVVINARCSLRIEADQRVIGGGGLPVHHYRAEDAVAEAYAMVFLVESGFAQQMDVARAFGRSVRGTLAGVVRPRCKLCLRSISPHRWRLAADRADSKVDCLIVRVHRQRGYETPWIDVARSTRRNTHATDCFELLCYGGALLRADCAAWLDLAAIRPSPCNER
jgi:hypothetical protein